MLSPHTYTLVHNLHIEPTTPYFHQYYFLNGPHVVHTSQVLFSKRKNNIYFNNFQNKCVRMCDWNTYGEQKCKKLNQKQPFNFICSIIIKDRIRHSIYYLIKFHILANQKFIGDIVEIISKYHVHVSHDKMHLALVDIDFINSSLGNNLQSPLNLSRDYIYG